MVDHELLTQVIVYVTITAGFLLVLFLSGDHDRLRIIEKDFRNLRFMASLAVVLAILFIGLSQDDHPNVKDSMHHGLTAVIASYFSHLDLVFPAFFFASIATYFASTQFGLPGYVAPAT
jgi:hypothetical protein